MASNLQYTVNSVGKVVTQIIHFSGGNKRTFSGILSNSIKQGEFTKMMTTDGRMIMINTINVDCIEVFEDDTHQISDKNNENDGKKDQKKS